MQSLTILQWATYGGLLFALIALIYRAARIARLPFHLRWELYPVPHEKGKGQYGGSYLEDFEWWTRPRQTDKLAELKEMLEEILVIKSLFKKNRSVWTFSFPFHLGLYLLTAFMVLLFVHALFYALSVDQTTLKLVLNFFTRFCGLAGIVFLLFGSLGLLGKRLFDYNLRSFSGFADYFNLIIFLLIGGAMLAAWLGGDYSFGKLQDYAAHLLTAQPFPASPLVTVEIASVLFFLVYLPFTHMTHFIAKYFTYHEIRWNDAPNEPNSKVEKEVDKVLNYPVSWAGPHIKGDGKKTWVDVATKLEDDSDGNQ